MYYAVQLLLAGEMAWVKSQKLWFKTETEKIHEKKKLKSLGAFPTGEVHNREEGEIG